MYIMSVAVQDTYMYIMSNSCCRYMYIMSIAVQDTRQEKTRQSLFNLYRPTVQKCIQRTNVYKENIPYHILGSYISNKLIYLIVRSSQFEIFHRRNLHQYCVYTSGIDNTVLLNHV